MTSSFEQVHFPRLRRHRQATAVPMAGALRAVETLLFSSGQQTARRNAWAAVVADRQRARDRREAEHEMAAASSAATAAMSAVAAVSTAAAPAGAEREGAARPR